MSLLNKILTTLFLILISGSIHARVEVPVDSILKIHFSRDIEKINKYAEEFIQLFTDNKKDSIVKCFEESIVKKQDNISTIIDKHSLNGIINLNIIPKSLIPSPLKKNIWALYFVLEDSDNNEVGWIFNLIDLNDDKNFLIHVITFQTSETMRKEGLYSLDDFFIP